VTQTKSVPIALIAGLLTGVVAGGDTPPPAEDIAEKPAATRPAFAVGLDFASAYVDNGITAGAGPVLQPAAEAEWHGLFLGGWGNLNLDDRHNLVETWHFSQWDWCAGYRQAVWNDKLTLSAAYGESDYAGPTAADRDRQVLLDAELDTFLNPYAHLEYTLECETRDAQDALYGEIGIGHDVDVPGFDGLTAGAGLLLGAARYRGVQSGLTHWSPELRLAQSFGETVTLTLSVAYIGRFDSRLVPGADYSDPTAPEPGYDIPVVGRLALAASF